MQGSEAFAVIEDAAIVRHGRAALTARLVSPASDAELRDQTDDRYLSLMSLRIFRAGLKHSLVDAKWPAFEEAFQGFAPAACAALSDEAIEALLGDKRLIRNLPKLRAIRANAGQLLRLSAEHGGFGGWLAAWPAHDVMGLWEELARQFQQLGGNSAPYFLRMAGKDTFILTDAVVKALVHWRAIEGEPRGKAARAKVQQAFNDWVIESGRPLCQISQILALSVD